MYKLRKFNTKEISLIIIPFLVLEKFFRYRPLVELSSHGYVFSVIELIFFMCCVPFILKKSYNDIISISVKRIIILLISSIFVGIFVSKQNITGGFSFTTHALCICIYFWFLKYNVSNRSIKQSILIILILYIIVLVYALATFPNNVLGYSEALISVADISIESRGTIRLGIPGQDLVILSIFYVLNSQKRNRTMLLLLIPLFILLAIRGTRTPLFVTIAISLCYLVWNNRYRFLIIIAGFVFIYLYYNSIMNFILESKSDNVLIKYIQLTEKQLNDQDEENIRIRMAKYYFLDFNKSFVSIIFGNGVPSSKGVYGVSIQKNKEIKGYFLSDISYALIFIYYGLIGLVIYFLLFFNVCKTRIHPDYEFAKLFVLYYFLVSVTGIYLVNSSMYMAIGLYLLKKNRVNKYNKSTQIAYYEINKFKYLNTFKRQD